MKQTLVIIYHLETNRKVFNFMDSSYKQTNKFYQTKDNHKVSNFPDLKFTTHLTNKKKMNVARQRIIIKFLISQA